MNDTPTNLVSMGIAVLSPFTNPLKKFINNKEHFKTSLSLNANKNKNKPNNLQKEMEKGYSS